MLCFVACNECSQAVKRTSPRRFVPGNPCSARHKAFPPYECDESTNPKTPVICPKHCLHDRSRQPLRLTKTNYIHDVTVALQTDNFDVNLPIRKFSHERKMSLVWTRHIDKASDCKRKMLLYWLSLQNLRHPFRLPCHVSTAFTPAYFRGLRYENNPACGDWPVSGDILRSCVLDFTRPNIWPQ